MQRRKTTLRSLKRKNTLVKIRNEFKKFKKLTRGLFRKKYGDPYLYKYERVSTVSVTPCKRDIPTQYHLNVVAGFVSNKDSHYNSYFKEEQIFISNIEYLFKYHSTYENNIKLHSSYKHGVTIIPNFYPQGKEVMSIVHSYHKDIAKFPFQGRKAYFRYPTRMHTLVNTAHDHSHERESLSSFVSKSISYMHNDFLYKQHVIDEDLDMTIENEDDSKFFTKSLLSKINALHNTSKASSSNLKVKRIEQYRDIRTHHNSLDSIEQLIEDIHLIEEDLCKVRPTRKEHIDMNDKRKRGLDENLLLTSIKKEFRKTYARSNTHYKFRTRKEKFGFYIFNKLNQITNTDNAYNEKDGNEYNMYTERMMLHHKPVEYFIYGQTSTLYKDEKKKNMVTTVMRDYHRRKFTKEKEMKREKIFKSQKQITKPKMFRLKTEQRFNKEWIRHKRNGSGVHKGLSCSRMISHRYCETKESEMLYCKTHDSILNPNEDKEKFRIENKTNDLMYRIKKRKEKLQEQIDKNYKTIRGKQISMFGIACCPDIYEHYGMIKIKHNN